MNSHRAEFAVQYPHFAVVAAVGKGPWIINMQHLINKLVANQINTMITKILAYPH